MSENQSNKDYSSTSSKVERELEVVVSNTSPNIEVVCITENTFEEKNQVDRVKTVPTTSKLQ